MDINNIPEFLKVGRLVKVQHWYGEIEDVAVSDKRIMLLIKSPKGIWEHDPIEWLEFNPQQIRPASVEEATQSIAIYTARVQQMLTEIEQTKQAWLAKAS